MLLHVNGPLEARLILLIMGLCLFIPILYIGYTDWKHRIIPNKAVKGFIIFGLIFGLITGIAKEALMGMTIIGLILLVVALLENMGGGDILLGAGIGAWFTTIPAIRIILIANIIAIIWITYIKRRNKKNNLPAYTEDMGYGKDVLLTYSVPFGTCMVIGIVVYMIYTIIMIYGRIA